MQPISKSRGKEFYCAERKEMSLSHCSSKSNHKLSKSSRPVSATCIIVVRFAHLFPIVHLSSPSMTYKTINSKGFVPDCEQIYFRYRCRRKQGWVGEKIPIFPLCLWLHLKPEVESFASACPPNIPTMIQVWECVLMRTADSVPPRCKQTVLQLQMANGRSERQTQKYNYRYWFFIFFCGNGFECGRKVSASKCKNLCFHKWYALS